MALFLDKVIQFVDEASLDYKDLTIIVPSQRMITYLHEAIFRKHQKPILAPNIKTINTWIQECNLLPIIDNTILLFELYKVFLKDPIKDENTTFDSFMSWAPMILSDFDEIDRYLIPANELFKNLHDIKVLESWNLDEGGLSQSQQRFFEFWEKLNPYYFALEKILQDKNVTTHGKSYKNIAQHIEWTLQENSKEKFVFAGFNALSIAETDIIKQLVKQGNASVLMDSDSYYFNDNLHEAGRFQRDLCKELQVKSLPFVENNLSTKSLKIDVVKCAQFTAQAQAIGSELKKLTPEQLDETLLLLADETLLSTMIKNLPAQIGKANITVGLPLKQTSFKSWFDGIFRIQESYLRNNSKSIYYKDFIQFTHHPFIVAILSQSEMNTLIDFESKIIKENWIYFDLKNIKLSEQTGELIEMVFQKWPSSWNEIFNLLQQLNALMDERLAEQFELEKALIRKFSSSLIPLQNAFNTQEVPEMSLATFKQLLMRAWQNETIAYYGNPTDGLQIMGLLETRGLDFKQVFVLGLNEGKMPPQNELNSSIPMDLRRYFNLPTLREKQGLFAHHFYRLLHYAESVFITYSVGSDSQFTSEPSRYILQLEMEMAQINRNIQFKYLDYIGGKQEKIKTLVIPNNNAIRERIKVLLKKGVSFSMIDKFVKCPLDFYYRYVLGLGEEDKVSEDIESNTLGSIIHKVMEELYKPFCSNSLDLKDVDKLKMLSIGALENMKNDIHRLTIKAFKEEFSADDSSWKTGMNLIYFDLVQKIITKMLNREIQLLKNNPDKRLYILGLEKKLETTFTVPLDKEQIEVKIKGICDRIDLFGEDLRIVDYKSANVKESNFEFNDVDEMIEKMKNHDAKVKFTPQLLTYSYLMKKEYNYDVSKAGIFSFKNTNNSPFFMNMQAHFERDNLTAVFESFIALIVRDMLENTIEFTHNDKSQFCEYCAN